MSILIWIPTFKRHSDGIPDFFSANVDFEKNQQTTKRCVGGGGGGAKSLHEILTFSNFQFCKFRNFPEVFIFTDLRICEIL